MLKLLLVILALLAVSNAVVDPCAEYQCSTPPPENCPEGCKFDNGCYYSVKQALEGQCVCKEPICHESPAPSTSEPHTEPVSEPVVQEPTEPHAEEPTTPHSEPVVGEEPKAEPHTEPVSEPVVKEPTEPHAEEPKAPVANECHCEPKEGISHTVKCPGTDYKKYYCMPVHQSKRQDSLVCDWVEKQCPIGVEVVITGDLSNKTAEIISTITEKVNEALGGSTDIEIVVQVKTEEGKTTVTVLVKGTTGQTINVDTKSITDAAVSQLLAEGYNVETTTNIGAPSSASSLQATLFVIVVALLVSLF